MAISFRDKDNRFAFNDIVDEWLAYNGEANVGVMTVDDDLCHYNSYTELEDGTVLYLYVFADEDVIRDVNKGRIELLSIFEHHNSLIFREEVDSDGKIVCQEVSYKDLPENELPNREVFIGE